MQSTDGKVLFKKGLEAFDQGDTLSALSYFEKAINIERSPAVCSYYAFCIAKERGQISNAISLCKEAIQKEPDNTLHYLNLGKIYLIENNKEEAIKTFRAALDYETNPLIIDELNKLGPRKPPILPFLERSNPINRYLGIIFRTKKGLKTLYVLLSLLLAVTLAYLLFHLYSEKPEGPSPAIEISPVVPPKPSELKPEISPSKPEVKSEIISPTSVVKQKEPPPPQEVKRKEPSPPSEDKQKEPFAEVRHQVAPQPSKVKQDKHTLELIAEDTTWIVITIDNGESKEMILRQGDFLKFSGKNIFSLKIGNAGGVKLVFDGKEIGPLGKEGQVVNLILPSPAIPSNNELKKNKEPE